MMNNDEKMVQLLNLQNLLNADTIEVYMADAYDDETLIGTITNKFSCVEELTEAVENIVDEYMYDDDGELVNGEGGFPILKSGNLEFIDLGSGFELK